MVCQLKICLKTVTVQMQNQQVTDDWTSAQDLFKHENYQAAADKYLEAARIVPDDPDTHFNLGAVYEAMSRLDDAIWKYRLATKLSPQNERYQKALEGALRQKLKSRENH